MFNQEVCFERLLFCTKLHNVTLDKNGRPLKVNGEEKVRETTNVQEHVVLATYTFQYTVKLYYITLL